MSKDVIWIILVEFILLTMNIRIRKEFVES